MDIIPDSGATAFRPRQRWVDPQAPYGKLVGIGNRLFRRHPNDWQMFVTQRGFAVCGQHVDVVGAGRPSGPQLRRRTANPARFLQSGS